MVRAPETAIGEAAGAVIPAMLRAVIACEGPARVGEVDAGIHDMRVATKRLREALRLFEPAFRRRGAKRHLKWVDGLNDALGEVRELDVTLARLRSRSAKLGAPAGMSELLERLGRARDGAHLWLVWHLDEIRSRERAAKLEAKLVRVRARANDPTDPAGLAVSAFAPLVILERLAAVRRRWERVRVDAREESLHRLRIANKRLRYAIEPFRENLPRAVSDSYKLATKFHDALGDLHDEEVLLHQIETALFQAPQSDRHAWEGLARDATNRRRKRLARIVSLGDRLPESWDSLARTLETPATPTEEAAAVAAPESQVPDEPREVTAGIAALELAQGKPPGESSH